MLKDEILSRSWGGITPGPQTAMWNGGVVGCPKANLPVLDEVVEVFDSMRPASRHFAIEQLATASPSRGGAVEEAARGSIITGRTGRSSRGRSSTSSRPC
jgi:hypothetical protein